MSFLGDASGVFPLTPRTPPAFLEFRGLFSFLIFFISGALDILYHFLMFSPRERGKRWPLVRGLHARPSVGRSSLPGLSCLMHARGRPRSKSPRIMRRASTPKLFSIALTPLRLTGLFRDILYCGGCQPYPRQTSCAYSLTQAGVARWGA